MATGVGKSECIVCRKEKAVFKCEGCSRNFCINHLSEHHREVGKQLDELEDKRNLFQQNFIEQKNDPEKHFLIKKIHQWEKESIEQIRQTAEEVKGIVMNQMSDLMNEIQRKFHALTKQLKQTREENDFNEIILNELEHKFQQLEQELHTPLTISINQIPSSPPFINKLSVVQSSKRFNIPFDAQWKQDAMVFLTKVEKKGKQSTELSNPQGVYIDEDQSIYVADSDNHRIIKWKNGETIGQIVAGGNGQGNRKNQLNWPTNVIVDRETNSLIICDCQNRRVVLWPCHNGQNGETIMSNVDCYGIAKDDDQFFYISDWKKNEVRRWKIGDKEGTIVAGGKGQGAGLDQLNEPRYIFIDKDHSLYISDCLNSRIVKWNNGATEGTVVAGGYGYGYYLKQLSLSNGIVLDQMGTLYIVDASNDRVVRWLKGAEEGDFIVGGNGRGKEADQFQYPHGITFDHENNLIVVDSKNQRIAKFALKLNFVY